MNNIDHFGCESNQIFAAWIARRARVSLAVAAAIAAMLSGAR